jgi:hypothetical protein
MKQAATKLNEASEITIPLRNLISMIAFTAVSCWVYFQLTQQISFLQRDLENLRNSTTNEMAVMLEEIEENDTWIDEWKPPEIVQATVAKVQQLEVEIAKIKLIISQGRQWN